MDILGILSFWIGIQNLDMNITQNDLQNMMQDLDKKTQMLLQEIHGHLKEQDRKIDQIMGILET